MDLHVNITVPLKLRLCGGSIKVPLINGKAETIYVTDDIQVIKKGGLFSKGAYGDLHVHFSVTFPVLTPTRKLQIGQLLRQ